MRCLRLVPCVLILAPLSPATPQIVGSPQYERVRAADPFLGNGYGDSHWGVQIRRTERQIDRARRSGAISRGEARALKAQTAGIGYLTGVYQHDRLPRAEHVQRRDRADRFRTRNDPLRDSVSRAPADWAHPGGRRLSQR